MVRQRPAIEADEKFLYELYTSTRSAEMVAWGWDAQQQTLFLRMQFMAQRQHYATQYAGAAHDIILAGEQPIGRVLVWRSPDEIRLVDIALLPQYRGQGIGTQLLQVLINEAATAHLPLHLNVTTDNPALRLYTRLGFEIIEQSGPYYRLQKAAT